MSAPVTLPVAPLAASAAFTESSFSPYPEHSGILDADWIVVVASSDQAGTVYVDQSVDAVSVARSDDLATSADPGPQGGQSALLKVQIVLPYHRVRYVNGTTAQARFVLVKRYVPT